MQPPDANWLPVCAAFDARPGTHNAGMSLDEAPNPFQRGTGSYPPVLGGRQAELAALHRLLSGLARGTLEQTIHLVRLGERFCCRRLNGMRPRLRRPKGASQTTAS